MPESKNGKRIGLYINEELLARCDAAITKTNATSRSEFIQKCYVLLFQYIHVCFIVRIANHIAKIIAETFPPELSAETAYIRHPRNVIRPIQDRIIARSTSLDVFFTTHLPPG